MEQVDKIPYIGRKLHKIGTWIWNFRWYFNMAFYAIPWTLGIASTIITNIVLNIVWNRWWAGGNIFLVGQTLYHVIMGIHVCFLMFEFELYLRPWWVKVFRIICFALAFVTSIIYFLLIIKWILMVYFTGYADEESWDFVSLFEACFLGYNILLNATILPINALIISKESVLPFI